MSFLKLLLSAIVGFALAVWLRYAWPAVFSVQNVTVNIAAYDASGHLYNGKATLTNLVYTPSLVSISYTSDDLFCNAFGPETPP